MGNYPTHREPFRKHAGYRICTYCGKTFKARGIGSHIRQIHKLVVRTILKTKVIDDSTIVGTKVIDDSTIVGTKVIDDSTIVAAQELSAITGKDLTECKRPDGQHLYTDQDLWILLSRINKVVLGRDASSLLSTWDGQIISEELIRDFEQRFDCKFRDIQKVNPHIKPGKTDQENWDIASKYAHLKYSRPGGFLQENWTKK
jgi:hypothetical protein